MTGLAPYLPEFGLLEPLGLAMVDDDDRKIVESKALRDLSTHVDLAVRELAAHEADPNVHKPSVTTVVPSVTPAITIDASGPSVTLTWGNDYDLTMDQNCDIALSGALPGVASKMNLILRGPFTPNLPAEVQPDPFSAPLQASYVWVELLTLDGGASVIPTVHATLTAPPSAPQLLRANPGSAQAVINWGAPAQNGGDPTITYTVVVRKHSDGTIVGVAHAGISPLTFTVTSLTNGTLYDVFVFASNSAGDSSTVTIQVTPAASAAAPGAVQNFLLTPGDAKVVVSYTDPASNGGSALTGFRGVITQGGGGVVVPDQIQAVSTNTVVSGNATPRQWSGWGSALTAHTVSAPTLPSAPLAGSALVACLFHNGNSALVTSAPAGFVRLGVALDSTGALPLGDGADVWCEVWVKASAAGTETGTFAFTLNGPACDLSLRVGEIPNLGTFRGASGVLSGGVYTHQNAWSASPGTTLSSGNTPNLSDANTFALGLFMSVDAAVASFSNSYVEVDAGQLTNTHIVTKQIAGGTGSPTSTTITDSAMNKCGIVLIWQVASASGGTITNTFAAAQPGSLLIGTLHHSTPGLIASLNTNGWSTFHSTTDTASGATVLMVRKTAVGGESSLRYLFIGTTDPAHPPVLTVQEWSGAGGTNALLQPAAVTATSLNLGASASIPTNSLVMIAATLTATEAVTLPSGFASDVSSGVAHVGTKITSGAGATGGSLSWPTSTHGVAILVSWDPAPSAHSQTIDVGAGVHSIEFDGLVNGVSHTIAVHAKNAIGNGPDITFAATPRAVVVPPSGGIAAIRANIGQAVQFKAWLDGQTSRWTNAAPVGPIPWTRWATNTTVETDFQTARDEFGYIGAPVTVGRFSGLIGDYNAGVNDSAIDANAELLEQTRIAQGGVPQIIRPLYEGLDSNWMPWSADPNNLQAWINAFVRICNRVHAISPTALVDLCMDMGYGGGVQGTGPDAVFAHSHSRWDTIVHGIQAKGVAIHYPDWDCYSNGPPGGTWVQTELDMIADRAVAWSSTNPGGVPCKVSHGEWGIGGLGPTLPASDPPHNWDAVVWTNLFLDWWASLPTSGPGSLGHIDLFDLGPFQGALPGGRSVSFVPDPPSNPDGFRVVRAFKEYLR